jgi:hypothetical protein
MDYTFRTIIVIALIAIYWYMRKKKKEAENPRKGAPGVPGRPGGERPVKQPDPPEVIYANHRKRALATTPQNLGPAGDVKEDEAYGLVMEMGIGDTVLTLACFADGDAGLYYQSGGGMKGGGSHENVRKAAKEFVALAQPVLPQMTRAKDTPLPEAGQVQFYALTPKGILTSAVDREALGAGSPFASLFYSGQEVVAQMRQVQAQKAS